MQIARGMAKRLWDPLSAEAGYKPLQAKDRMRKSGTLIVGYVTPCRGRPLETTGQSINWGARFASTQGLNEMENDEKKFILISGTSKIQTELLYYIEYPITHANKMVAQTV
jgi:hypothetical protein